MPLHVSSTCAHHQEVKLYYTASGINTLCRWPSGAQVERESSTCFEHYVFIIRRSKLYYTASGIITPVGGRLAHRLRESPLHVSSTMCLSSGGQNCIIHHLESSHCVGEQDGARDVNTCFGYKEKLRNGM